MPAPRDESVDPLPLLQKQLILSQVQILELEDVRDELKTALAQRDRILAELQTIADRALAETQQARTNETAAQKASQISRDEQHALQLKLESLQRETKAAEQQLLEIQGALTAAKTVSVEQAGHIEALDAQLRKMKVSRSWRWTAPLRSIERLLR